MSKIPVEYYTDASLAISPKFLPASLLGVSAGICQRAAVDESGMIVT
jgi:hypothetical protein